MAVHPSRGFSAATEVKRFDDDGWVVLADPDGNQFCVVSA